MISNGNTLSFVKHENHKDALKRILKEFNSDNETLMLFLVGSVARGDALPGSDLDIWRIVDQKISNSFRCEIVENVFTEIHSLTLADALQKIEKRPMLSYGIIEGKCLIDKNKNSGKLVQKCTSILAGYRPTSDQISGTLHWLKSLKVKMGAGIAEKDYKKAIFALTTSYWELLSAFWMINNKPIPPSGSVLAHLKDLANIPDRFLFHFDALLMNSNNEKIKAGQYLTNWAISELEKQYKIMNSEERTPSIAKTGKNEKGN